MQKFIKNIFFILTCLSVTAAIWVFKDLLFPFVTSKAFFFRIAIESALPFYLYLIISDRKFRPSLKNPLNITALVFLVINILTAFTGVNVTRSLWGNFERMGGAFYLANLIALYFYVLLLGQLGSRNNKDSLGYLWFGGMGLLAGVVISVAVSLPFVTAFLLIAGFIGSFCIVHALSSSYIKGFLYFLLFTALLVTGNGIFGWLHLPTFVQDPSLPVRVSSTLGNPIYLGSYLIIPFYLAIFFGIQSEGAFKRIAWYFLSALFLLGIFLSGTRGAAVGLVLGSFFCTLAYLFFTKNKNIKTYGLAAVGVFVVVCGICFTYSDKLPQGSTIQRLFKLKDSNTEARLLQWKVALKGYKDSPVFGVGSENYYAIANKYYNPQIFQYDRSWFDKPHNYILEILVTNGIFGLIAYLGLLWFMAAALYKGYKSGLFGLAELCVMLGALLAYQIQNLTVFDTVPASLMFYSFAGFSSYIWNSALEDAKESINVNMRQPVNFEALPAAVFGVSLAVMAYVIYAGNVAGMVAAKNVNYGYAYISVDPEKSLNYFETAVSAPFNFDRSETSSKFADFAQTFVRNPGQNQALAIKILDEATSYLEIVLTEQPDNPILWQRLSTLYLFKSVQTGNAIIVNPKAIDALNKSKALAPDREENFTSQAQILALQGDYHGAQAVLEDEISKFPTDQNAKIQLSQIYRLLGNITAAAQEAELAISQGYNFTSAPDMKWLIDYYVQNKKFDKAVVLQEQASKLDGSNIQEFVELAKLYAQNGQTQQALNMAKGIMNYDTTTAPQMQELIDSINKAGSSTPAQ